MIMMRLLFLLAAFGLSVTMADAKPLTRAQAQQKAVAFMAERHDNKTLMAVTNTKKLAPRRGASETLAADPYYVFDRGEGEGFVIVSGDDQTVGVLGFCETGTFDYEQMPPNMRALLDDYARQIELIQTGKAKAAPVITASGRTNVPALMTCKWSQGEPYNNACPLDAGKRSVTGCVATAIAQILYYNREKMVNETQAAMPGYSTWTKGISVPGIAAGAPIDWDNMKDTYGSANDKQKKAVANLMLYCGVGSKMDYTNSSSGAQSWDAYQALLNYFGLTSAQWRDYTTVTSNEEWDRIVYEEMAAGRPVYMSGSNDDGGHAFVAHGYRDGKYIINWGWGGQSDGEYYISNLTPGDGQGIGGSSSGYNAYRQFIIHIEPENYTAKAMNITDAAVKKLCIENWDADGDGNLTFGEAAAVTSLGQVFKGKTTLKNFKELYYFTGLTEIADDAFNGCSQLTSLRLPKGIRTLGDRAFMGCAKLNQLEIHDGLQAIGEDAFNGCKVLPAISLPTALTSVPARAFKDCAALTTISLPISVTAIGDEAFAGCAKLTSFTVNTFQPGTVSMGASVFDNIDLQKAVLNVMQGTKAYFAATEQWKDFGSIIEKRELSGGAFAELEAGKMYYVYNVGTGRYLTKGEAYGTQAVVGTAPMRFEVKRSSSMPEGVYYFSSPDTGKEGKFLFRTSTDDNVGKGINAVFVDGTSLSGVAYWAVQSVGNQVYTIQTPSNQNGYAEGRYLGVQTDHESGAASPTYGAYFDVPYADHTANCQWRFVLYDEDKEAQYEAAVALGNLLAIAKTRGVKCQNEQAVYDRMESSRDELVEAQRTLRKKLKFIDFASDDVRSQCVTRWDLDFDGELSYNEAARVSDFDLSFSGNKTLESFDEFKYFTGIKYVYGRTFYGCTNMTSVTLPENVEKVYYYAFYGCKALEEIRLPRYVNTLGNNCFTSCTNLKSVYVEAAEPFAIVSNVFGTRDAENFTIYVPFGSKAKYEAADVWKDYTIKEMRGPAQPQYSSFAANKVGYFVNVATGKILSKGEAYGTQSVVDHRGMRYQLKRTKAMPEGCYYFYSDETGKDQKVLFRVSTDSKVGEGVKACFVDGTLETRAYWKIDSVAPGTYTFSVPEGDESYVAGQYLGVDENHESGVASPTYGTYWDLKGTGTACQWRFVAESDYNAALAFDILAEQLLDLLERAGKQGLDVSSEQAVYDSPSSTMGDFGQAIQSLREKLHYIIFQESGVRSICLTNWDDNGDEELSYEEAAAVTDIGEVFRNMSSVKQFAELRYFTSLTAIPENAFRGASSLQTVYLPERVDTIGKYAFFSTALRYLVLLNGQKKVPVGSSSLPLKSTVFVPASVLDSYLADEDWSAKYAVEEYTGKPVVTAEASREYGRRAASIAAKVTGAPIDGTPEYACEAIAEPTLPIGEYVITVMPGTVTTPNTTFVDGTVTILPATLTVTANSYQRNIGEENPVFDCTYKGFRNSETEEVLTTKPVVTCEATAESPAGSYEIVVSGAEAANYVFDYVAGELTVIDPAGIQTLTTTDKRAGQIFDIQGRKVSSLKSGLYIMNNRKVVVR